MDTTNNTTEYKPLHMTRTFNAPRQMVWDAWTQPQQLAKWYAPAPFTIPNCELDVRPQGQLHIDMKSPDGTVYPSSGEFKEVVPPERLAFLNSPLDTDGSKLFEVLHTLTLTEADGKTTLDLTSEVISAGPKAGPFLAGMEAGLTQALDQLATVVEQK